MKRLNLGKLIAICLLLPWMLMAGSVSAKLDRTVIYKGESATLTLSANGDQVTFPELQEIGTSPVIGTSTQQSIQIINGATTKSLSKSYQFVPQESLVIPSYTIEVDGESLQTPPLTLKVTKPSPTGKNSPVQLEMKVDKQEAYVGEPIHLYLTFKSLPNARYDKIELSEPELKDFWVKKLPNLKQGTQGAYHTQTYTYVLFPQQAGEYTIPAPFAQLGKYQRSRRDDFFNDPFFGSFGRQLKWSKIYANDLKLNIKSLPEGLEIFGDFQIQAKVDKTTTKANQPVNLTIEIKGQGNLEDIKKFDLNIDNALLYSDEPVITNSGPTKGFFEQKIAIVADENFTIPAIEFSYFDQKSHQPKTITTKPIKVTVIGDKKHPIAKSQIIEQKEAPKQHLVTTDEPRTNEATPCEQKDDSAFSWIWYLLGLLSGVILSLCTIWIKDRLKTQQSTPKPLRTKIKKAKDDKTLFALLLPYKEDDPELKTILQQLEENIYHGASHKIDKQLILEIIEDLNL